jgi:hypothetical protein
MKNSADSLLKGAAVALVCAAALPACIDAVVGDVGLCKQDGKSYALHETFPSSDGCNSCACAADGSIACTNRACVDGGGGSDGGTGAGVVDGKSHPVGETFPSPDGCNSCTCSAGGNAACTERGCAPAACTYGGKSYAVGDTFSANDCGNTCTCTDQGVACTAIACATKGCEVEGTLYQAGEIFKRPSDPCNTCTCQPDGNAACTLLACGSGTDGGTGSTDGGTGGSCVVGDTTFASGQTAICADGCNHCGCDNGQWWSTLIGCPSLPKLRACTAADATSLTKLSPLYLDGDALALTVSQPGCVGQSRAELCISGGFAESSPVQARLLAVAPVTSCSAIDTHQQVFDISLLRSLYEQSYKTAHGTIALVIDGGTVRYTF